MNIKVDKDLRGFLPIIILANWDKTATLKSLTVHTVDRYTQWRQTL